MYKTIMYKHSYECRRLKPPRPGLWAVEQHSNVLTKCLKK